MSHIKFTKTHRRIITKVKCGDCKKDSYFVSFYEEWYGWDSTCMRCGRTWVDGEWTAFDIFGGFVRKTSKEDARKRWKRGLDESTIKQKEVKDE